VLERKLYPRLSHSIAESVYDDLELLTVSDLTSRAATVHDKAIYAATGGERVGSDTLNLIRTLILDAVTALGFPRPLDSTARFDLEMSERLYDGIVITPGEAARAEVWSFLALVVLPDVARWRFPTAGRERFVGGVRNTLQRLWWRAYTLAEPEAADRFHLMRHLSEDALVQIMERPGVSSDHRLAREIARRFISMVERVPASALEDARRFAVKRVRQRMAIVRLDALAVSELNVVLDELFADAVAFHTRGLGSGDS
jgi:hypothetical protein